MNNEVKAKGTRIDIPNEVASMVATAQRAGFDEAKLRALEILGDDSFEPRAATPEDAEVVEGAVEAFRVLAYRRLSQIKLRSATFRMLETDDSDEEEAATTMCKSFADVVACRVAFAFYGESGEVFDVVRPIAVKRIPDSFDEMTAFDAQAAQTQLEADFQKAGIEATQAAELARRGARALEDVVDLALRLKAKNDAEAAENDESRAVPRGKDGE